jgi:HD-GYP domain-containing protein (c-di-GMP phosphodiesterase class II)
MPAEVNLNSGIRRAEFIAALSMATDLAVGQPMELALKSCVLAMRLGQAMKLSDDELAEVYWYGLLRYVGCNAEAHAVAALLYDDIEFNQQVAVGDMGRAGEVMPLILAMLRKANAGAPPFEMLAAITRGFLTSQNFVAEMIASHCEVAERLAERLGFGAGLVRDLGQIQERWDGRGFPRHLKGEAIAPAVRIVNFARDAVVLIAAFGEEAATAKLRARSRGAYDPRVVELFTARAAPLMADLGAMSCWSEVLELEPEPRGILSEAELDEACLAAADAADIRSPYLGGHSRAVSELAGEAARRCGLPVGDAVDLGRAGLWHDIGQAAASARIFVKSGPLSETEREAVRLHPYYGERILSRPAGLARLGAMVGQHHERIDGSGYHRGTGAAGLAPQGRILAAAEAYRSMTEARSYRPALSADQAATELKQAVRAGQLDGEAATAVLAASGHRMPPKRRQLVADLTGRELDVLRLVAGGQSMKEIGRRLGISPKTVDNHIQHLYGKIETKTRAGATLFAIEHGLAIEAWRF